MLENCDLIDSSKACPQSEIEVTEETYNSLNVGDYVDFSPNTPESRN